MAFTVTVTNTSTGAYTGVLVRVLVLDNAVLAATPATAKAADVFNVSITTTTVNSMVYGSVLNYNAQVTFTPEGNCTFLDNVPDSGNGTQYGSFYTTSPTSSPAPTTVGASGTGAAGSISAIEVLPVGGTAPSTDASSPGSPFTTTSATALTTASFTPPAGKLIVVLALVDGGTGGTGSASISDTSGLGLTWAPYAIAAGPPWTGIWTTTMPGAGTVTGARPYTVQQAIKRASLW